MKVALAIVLAVHAAIHLLGFVKAWNLARVPQLTTPISKPVGLLFVCAAGAFAVAAIMLLTSAERWWAAAALAVVASQAAIFVTWSDAKAGTLVNLVVVVPVVLALLDLRSSSLRSIYRSEVDRSLARATPTELVSEADLAPLPPLVQTYLRRAGVVGQPFVQNLRIRWHGEMRNGEGAPWMKARIEQVELFDDPTRLFFMTASRSGVPFQALHVYEKGTATMQVRIATLIDVVDARGPKMDQSETVTLFNDMCLLAPASLLRADVVWETLDDRHVRAAFTNAGHTIRADLTFDAQGDLVDFLSNDRYQSADGKTYRLVPWSTPVTDYRDFHGLRIAARGDAVWKEAGGDFTYARFEIEDLELNVRLHGGSAPASVEGPRTALRERRAH